MPIRPSRIAASRACPARPAVDSSSGPVGIRGPTARGGAIAAGGRAAVGGHLDGRSAWRSEAPWKVRESTSSCCSRVSRTKFTAYPETRIVSCG